MKEHFQRHFILLVSYETMSDIVDMRVFAEQTEVFEHRLIRLITLKLIISIAKISKVITKLELVKYKIPSVGKKVMVHFLILEKTHLFLIVVFSCCAT